MQSITNKNYRKLVLKISLSGFSFVVINTLSDEILMLKEISFDRLENPNHTEACYKQALSDWPELSQQYDEVLVLHHNNLSAFVPSALFDENALEDYLKYNIKTFETDFFTSDTLGHYSINNIYVPYVHINNLLLDHFSEFDYRHASSILVEKLLDKSVNNDEKLCFVHFDSDTFQIVIVQNQKLLFYNTFDFKTQEDFAYYLLFVIEQLGLNPETIVVTLLGNIAREGALFDIAHTYIRNLSFLEESQIGNNLSETDNRTHFILLKA